MGGGVENIGELINGFGVALTPYHLTLMVAGVLFGILVGVLPGLGAPNGVTLLIPLTFAMEPVSAIILLASMYWGALFGVLLITLLSGAAAQFAHKFSSPEYFAVYFLAFSCFVGLGGASPFKTVVSAGMGFALAAVGMDTISGSLRLTYGIPDLVKGVSFLVAVIGLFGLGELIATMEEKLEFRGVPARVSPRDVLTTIAQLPRYWVTLLRSSLVGCWMGITPGGPTAASFMSYGLARRFSPRRDNFGRGEPEGVIAPETADHSAGTCAMLPMLALGIPGSATAAVMMGGLMIWGLHPGPMLFVEQKSFVWGLIASMYVANVVAVVLVLFTVPLFAAILRIPFAIIGPLIVVVCFVGAWTVAAARFDLWLALAFGLVGYVFKKADYPIAPLVLAMVVGDKAEDAFRQSMIMAKGSLAIFWSNALSGTLMTLAFVLLFWPLLSRLFGQARAA